MKCQTRSNFRTEGTFLFPSQPFAGRWNNAHSFLRSKSVCSPAARQTVAAALGLGSSILCVLLYLYSEQALSLGGERPGERPVRLLKKIRKGDLSGIRECTRRSSGAKGPSLHAVWRTSGLPRGLCWRSGVILALCVMAILTSPSLSFSLFLPRSSDAVEHHAFAFVLTHRNPGLPRSS